MSHFTCAVFTREGQTVDELLAPYDENMPVDRYVQYTRQEAIKDVREWLGKDEKTSDEECWEIMASDFDEDMIDEEGNLYSTRNPDAKWDWYDIGGRWGDYLKVRGKRKNTAKVKEIDFSPDQDVYKAALDFWDKAVDNDDVNPEDKIPTLFTRDYYREFYGDRETYARHQAQFSTFAVILPDGSWHERGSMGYFGMSSETGDEARDWEEHYKERFIDPADPEWTITICDLHI